MSRINRTTVDASANTAAELSAMIYGGKKPWHGCGQQVPDTLSWRDVPALDPIGYSDRELRPLQTLGLAGGVPRMIDVPGSNAVVRTGDDRVLSVVGDRYRVIQPRDMVQAMAELADVAGAKLTTAGFLRDGSLQWAQAKIPGLDLRIPIGAKDKPASVLEENLTMFNSYDGTLPFVAGGAATDIVCQNTFMHALKETKGSRMFRIRHTKQAAQAIADMVQEIKAMRDGFTEFAQIATQLAETRMSDVDFVGFTEALVPNPVDASPTKAANKRAQLFDAWRNAPGQQLDGKRNTAWGALSAVTFFTTWQAPVKSDNESAARWYNATLGDGADLADTAFQTLRVYAGV